MKDCMFTPSNLIGMFIEYNKKMKLLFIASATLDMKEGHSEIMLQECSGTYDGNCKIYGTCYIHVRTHMNVK